MQNWLQNN